MHHLLRNTWSRVRFLATRMSMSRGFFYLPLRNFRLCLRHLIFSVALKRHGSLHILADRFDDPPSRASTPSVSRMDSQRTVTSASMKPKLTHMASTSGLHFERLVELPNCVNGRTFADWDAATQTLKVSVGRRALEGWQIKELQQASSQQKQPNTLAASTLSDRDRERRSSLPGNV